MEDSLLPFGFYLGSETCHTYLIVAGFYHEFFTQIFMSGTHVVFLGVQNFEITSNNEIFSLHISAIKQFLETMPCVRGKRWSQGVLKEKNYYFKDSSYHLGINIP
jgi:hypothetical protein